MPKLSTRLKHFRTGSPLSFKLLAWIILFSSAFTLVASALQIYIDYQKDRMQIEHRLKAVEASYASGLSTSLWTSDRTLLQTQMEGILRLPDVVHLRLNIEPDDRLVMGNIPRNAQTTAHSFKLVHQDDDTFRLGDLTVTADLRRVCSELERKVGMIILTQFVNTFFVSILIIWIFRHFVTRHLTTMANYAREFSLSTACRPLTLDRPNTASNRHDELGRVTEAINQMRERLNFDMERQQKDAAEIRKLSKAIEQSPSSVLICDHQWRIEFANQKFTQLTGHAAASIIGKHPGAFGNSDSEHRKSRRLWQSIRRQVQRAGAWQGEINSVRRNKERFWEQVIVTPIKNESGEYAGFLILGEDISIRKRYEQQLLRQANYDVLTGLPNRMLALDRLKLALAHGRREGMLVGVMFLDLDNFKHINDTLGHDAGDSLLVAAARRISGCLRGTSTVARLGGDEFLVILPGMTGPTASSQVAERILNAFSLPYNLDGQDVFVTTSIGIATFPIDADSSSMLLKHADAAMYQAKHKGKSAFAHFRPEMSEVSPERLKMESRMQRALELKEFELYYQPVVHTHSGKLCSVEALLRWNCPALGMIGPDHFIPLAEESGQIIPIGAWVLETACRAAVRWKSTIGKDIRISVNVSARQFRDPGFSVAVSHALSSSGLTPDRLELEITERLIMDNARETAEIIRQLNKAGVRFSMDDFGTGYSSLGHLRGNPFDTLKIDKTVVQNLAKDPGEGSFIRAIIGMGRSLGLSLVAEGVEDEAQAHFLKTEGCDFSQGYFFSRPLSAPDFDAWLANHDGA